MTLIAILALTVSLAAVWRLTRFVVKLLLLGALITLIASYGTSAHRAHAPGTISSTRPTSARPARPTPRSKSRPRNPVKRQ